MILMDFRYIFNIFLTLIFVLVLFGNGNPSEKPNGRQKRVLHKTLKALLNFNENFDDTADYRRPKQPTDDIVSKYMKELFVRYKNNRNDDFGTNTVRSIAPKIGVFDGQDALIFNLNSLRPSEEIVRAEIHYNLGEPSKSRRWKEKKSREILCYRITASDGQEKRAPGRLELPKRQEIGDWLIFDAQPSVISVLDSGRNDSRFAVIFAVKSHRFKMISLRKITRHNHPFLLLFTDDKSLIDAQQMMNVVKNDDGRRVKRHAVKDSSQYYHYSLDDKQKQENRSDFDHLRAFRQQGPAVLQDTKKIRRHRQKTSKFRKQTDIFAQYKSFGALTNKEKEKQQDTLDLDSVKQKQLFANPKQSPFRTHENDAALVLLDDDPSDICQKKDLVVEFSDIGWGEWIIAPKSFEAHYCAGACPFPLPSNSNPSNHAVIQSIIHTVGLHPGVPQICCAPEKMDSLTLLYFDEEQNVVLKNYPKMTVSSCGCL